MRLFDCPACGNIVHFENRFCGNCQSALGYVPEENRMAVWLGGSRKDAFVPCANADYDACNWLVNREDHSPLCRACRHNGTVPDLSNQERVLGWKQLEDAKHRLFYSLLRWNLPLSTRANDPHHGLIFNFLADDPVAGLKVMTGHDNGVITIALAEANDIERERRRLSMNEPYRTLLGHFRHEVGHHYWDLLIRDGNKLDAFRTLFGDDRTDYGEALKRHYEQGSPPDWRNRFVSAYAASHPWEDFAESWAHYTHIVDTLEMAADFGLEVKPSLDRIGGLSAAADFDPYMVENFVPIARAWLPFVFAMNSVSRAMGTRDLYPFVLAPPVLEKLSFIHGLIRGR